CPSPPTQAAAVPDVRKCRQLTAGDMNETRQAQYFGRSHGDETGSAGPYRVDQLESRSMVLRANRANRPQARVPHADVVNVRAGQVPGRSASFLEQGKY